MDRIRLSWFVAAVLAIVPACRAELPLGNGPAMPETTLGQSLQDLAARAGVIFVGQVTAIQHNGGIVDVVFRVDKPIRGQLGGAYTMREWGGLWEAGQQRYRVGQRALFFLNAPSSAGLSSPVDDMQGVVPLVPMGADGEPLLDARWLATRLMRPPGLPLTSLEESAITLSDAVDVICSRTFSAHPEPVEPVLRPLPVGVRPAPVTLLPAPQIVAPGENSSVETRSLRGPYVLQ